MLDMKSNNGSGKFHFRQIERHEFQLIEALLQPYGTGVIEINRQSSYSIS